MKKTFFLFFLSLTIKFSFAQKLPQLGKNTNAEVMAAMTLDEKVRLLIGMGMKMPGTNEYIANSAPVVGETNDKVPGCAGTTFAIPRLGIPSVVLADGPAGIRISPKREGTDQTYFCTAFPIASLLASTWDLELVEKVGDAMGSEAKAYGVDIFLAPALNIHRNALGGRNFEYYSEDPIVSGKMAAAMIRGVQKHNVGTSAKHFAVNNQETNRNLINVKVGEQALREIYLKGFEIAVKEGKPMTIMSAYNKINGVYASQNTDLLTKVLREDWQYDDVVMTDWFGGDNPVAQLQAGNEWIMPGVPAQVDAILNAIKEGKLSETIVNRSVDRVLNVLKKTNTFLGITPTNAPDLKKNAAIARSAAAEGMILLKNNNDLLPLKNNTKMAVLGNGAYALVSGGTGSGDVNEAYTISLPEGLKNAGFGVNTIIQSVYEGYIATERAKQPKQAFFMPPTPIQEMPVSDAIITTATQEDVAVITISRISGEFVDRKKEVDFDLSENEKQLLKKTSTAFHQAGKKVIVVLNIGGAIETASWRDEVDAILLAWLPGQEAGNAIADVLSGQATPSGKLTTSMPEKYQDEATSKNFPGKNLDDKVLMSSAGFPLGNRSEVTHEEGIYVGYRYYQTFEKSTAFDFGSGQSYTNFEYSNLKVKKGKNGDMEASFTVKNTGKRAGKEIAQLYVTAPDGTIEKPAQALKGFTKTKLLQSGESQTVTIKVTELDLASFDEKTSTWTLEKGKYEMKIGASSKDIRQKTNVIQAKTKLLQKVNKALTPEQPIKAMSKKDRA
jgi:beta-glucosidase